MLVLLPVSHSEPVDQAGQAPGGRVQLVGRLVRHGHRAAGAVHGPADRADAGRDVLRRKHFLAGPHRIAQHLDLNEFLDVEYHSLESLRDMVLRGEIADGKTVAGVLKTAATAKED